MSADKRSVSTDALETLGMIHDREEKRDAIHLAVIPAEAGESLAPGEHVAVIGGKARSVGAYSKSAIGIVDPFLGREAEPGERFWLVIYPRKITSLRHVWSHPAFPDEAVEPPAVTSDDAKREARAYLELVAARHDVSLEQLLEGAEDHLDGGDGICFGTDIEYGIIDIDKLWRCYEVVTGKTAPEGKRGWFFRCAC